MERFGLASQMRRACVSIASNIVEGSSRESEAEYVRFIEIAHGSARELAYQASLAIRLELLSADSSLEDRAEQIARMLSGLLKTLRSR